MHAQWLKADFATRFPIESSHFFPGPIYPEVAKRDLGYVDRADRVAGQVMVHVAPPVPRSVFSPARLTTQLSRRPANAIDLTDGDAGHVVVHGPPSIRRNPSSSAQLTTHQSRRTVNAIEQSPSKKRASLFGQVVKRK